MKKLLLSLGAGLLLMGSAQTSKAQLADGSVAPDFTITDANGNTHTLYDYLDQGYTVVLDMFATWCGPCWNYHTAGILEDVYINHGPAGMAGVSGSTTDDMMVMAIDVDPNTTNNDLNGTGGNTTGDWVTGTLYAISNPASSQASTLNNQYNIAYYPTVYQVCPNRIIKEVGQLSSATAHHNEATQCPPPASDPTDPTLLGYLGETVACGPVDLTVRLQNNGTNNLTSATIVAMDGGTQVASVNWTGNLATYDIDDVVIGQFTPSAATNLTFDITSTDDNTSNNQITETIDVATQINTLTVTVKIESDAYGSETTWNIKNSSGATVASGGPYNDLGSAGTTVQPDEVVNLPSNDCYFFNIYDSYGDGMCCAYGNGGYEVVANGTTIASGGSFDDEDNAAFEALVTSVDDLASSNSVSIYPNPVNEVANIQLDLDEAANVQMDVLNTVGQVVYSESMGTLSGSIVRTFNGASLANGMYIVNFTIGDEVITKRISINK